MLDHRKAIRTASKECPVIGRKNPETQRRPDEGGTPKRAAEYVRMSTEHQQYSTENQAKVIRQYAAARNLEVVRTYADEGKSGLTIGGRDALQRMIDDVESGKADYDVILVYDVSRWGRFQDVDESGHYEYTCRLAGIDVAYCAEQFENDGSPLSAIIKAIRRGNGRRVQPRSLGQGLLLARACSSNTAFARVVLPAMGCAGCASTNMGNPWGCLASASARAFKPIV